MYFAISNNNFQWSWKKVISFDLFYYQIVWFLGASMCIHFNKRWMSLAKCTTERIYGKTFPNCTTSITICYWCTSCTARIFNFLTMRIWVNILLWMNEWIISWLLIRCKWTSYKFYRLLVITYIHKVVPYLCYCASSSRTLF